MAVYNAIGSNYNFTRRADPYITGRLYHLLNPDATGKYIDIGCGTANYLTALSAKGLNFCGIDPSATMLEKARQKNNNATFLQASADAIPFPGSSFSGAIATFTLHHWGDMQKGLDEACRILKPGSNFVMLSFTPEQMRHTFL